MRWSKEDDNPDSYFTTMFDLYRLPTDFPDHQQARAFPDPYERVRTLQEAFARNIDRPRFVPYIQLHEFETLLLADPRELLVQFPASPKEVRQLTNEISDFASPELVDDGENTAPSKRIIRLIPEYKGRKSSAGPVVAASIGLTRLRARCPHFAAWLSKLESLPS
jgi:hypothetical protein